MTTQAIAGYIGKFYISDDGGSNYYELGETKNATLTKEADMGDATSHASGGWKENVPLNKGFSISADALYISADVAQDKVRAALQNGTKLLFRLDPEGTSTGKERWSGAGYMKSWKIEDPTSDLAAVGIEITGTGALTESVQ